MNRTKFIYFALLCCSILVLATSCKSKKGATYSALPVEDKANSALFSDILRKGIQYNTLSSKLTIEVMGGTRSLSSKASLRIVRDRALQISIQPLFGVEMFRLHVDKDTIVVLDRMNKRYVRESLASLKEVYPIGFDYYSLQALFTNSLFVAGRSTTLASDYSGFDYSQTPDRHYLLKTSDAASGIEYSFTINGNDDITFAHLAQPKQKYSLQWSYDNFDATGNHFFPYSMRVLAQTSSRKLDVGLSFSQVDLNTPMELTMSVPESYTRVTMSEILKIISSN